MNGRDFSLTQARLDEDIRPRADDADWRAIPGMFRALVDLPAPWEEMFGPLRSGKIDPLVVVGQVGQSLDGRIATTTGSSRYINGSAGLAHLHRLRALVDAVVVGVDSAVADDPRLTVRYVIGPDPARVVRDGNVITGGGVTAGIDFALAVAAEIGGEALAQSLQLAIEYAPAPPFDAGRPETAPAEIVALVRSRLAPQLAERTATAERAAARL